MLGRYRLAPALWFVAAVLWLLLSYVIFTAFTVKQKKPILAEGINGGWLIAVVAIEAVSEWRLCSLLFPQFIGSSFCSLHSAYGCPGARSTPE